MPRIIVLDSGPLSDVSRPIGHIIGDRCRAWVSSLTAKGDNFVVPEIADYEVRRELARKGYRAGLARLDSLMSSGFVYAPVTTDAWRRAAAFWGVVRNLGKPTAPPDALDGDAILAGQAAVLGLPGDPVIIATTNVGHLGRFPGIDARLWNLIT